MLTSELLIINKLGLHARATAKLVRLLQQYQSEVNLEFNGLFANGKSIMSVMMLAASQGSLIKLSIKGSDEEQCSLAITQLFSTRFGESE